MQFIIGRQPIFDRSKRIYGYELLYRGTDPKQSSMPDGSLITEQLLADAILEYDLDALCGQARAFVNMTRENLLSDVVHALPADRVVIEILENVHVDATLVAAVECLVKSGYIIALDDFVFSSQWEPLLRLARIVKIDVLAYDTAELASLIHRLRSYDVKLLAEKVETSAMLQWCLDNGCSYFQGYYLQQPQLVKGKRLATHQLSKLRLLAAINAPHASAQTIAEIVRTDPSLSIKLLKFINSAHFALPRRIESIKQAVVLLGLAPLRRWTTLLVLSESESENSTHTLHLALTRARMCERLAEVSGHSDSEAFFLVGLLSILESHFQTPLMELLNHLPLDKGITDGLLGKGLTGKALQCALAYEQWRLEHAHFANLDTSTIGMLYLESLNWAYKAIAQLQ